MIGAESTQVAAAELGLRLDGASPIDIIGAALGAVPPGRLAVVSSFGIESAVLLKFVADVDRSIPVLFLDTGWLFPETIAYRERVATQLALRDVRSVTATERALASNDPERDLWSTDPDACCNLRKVVPLAAALAPFDAWITGRKRYQGGERTGLPIVESDGVRLKFNPLAKATREQIAAVFAASGLPEHPLAAFGYQSIGCLPCTSRSEAGEDQRAGRWRGSGKTECGIHSGRARARCPDRAS
jgi:phosphoadenosine phosphosulfate reductase